MSAGQETFQFEEQKGGSPPTDAKLEDALRLSMVSGVGPRLRQALLDRFGDAASIFRASESDLRSVQGIGAKISREIVRARSEIDIAAEIETCRANQVSIVPIESPDYPRALKEIHDPPGVLYVQGAIQPRDALAIAIVGSRHCTLYGQTQAERLAGSLSRAGLTIVSGLARGIDASAHRGAINAGGRTLAVLGSGLLNIYPPEHASLAVEVCAAGALISENHCNAKPMAGAFPQRNRIISGMSLGVVVVEASLNSGALITARLAMEQGREVFAVPGRVDSRASQGCHRLLRDGAKLVESADDVLEELGPLVEAAVVTDDGQTVRHPAELLLNPLEQQVLDAVGVDSTAIDHVISKSQLPAHQVLSTLSVLEMRRLIRRLAGSTVVRV